MLGCDILAPIPGTNCREDCANKWRGMLFGMTNRAGWNGYDPNDNKNVWKLWDNFGIVKADMYGWWNKSCPVTTGRKDVLATAFVRSGISTLIAVASWSVEAQNVIFQINWDNLGLKAERSELIAPYIPSFNRASMAIKFPIEAPISVPAYQGWLLVIRPRSL
eukprot:TRINITY_DN1187_c0_g2_i2.p1 TRINITY_DN1187_c0_g2~~TRINITY_DN1187_c0_g2_i2.p1  ORF type:complete len:183 (-),score=6.52 TRINITY_DN1187_c0_g2_i2:173-661(-)